jgi:hypothetical protein
MPRLSGKMPQFLRIAHHIDRPDSAIDNSNDVVSRAFAFG